MASVTIPASSCTASAIPTPTLFGAEILAVSATPVLNFTRSVSEQIYYNHPNIAVNGVDFCNITVTYTHPGQNDSISVESWLPLSTWNGRLQSVGGGGWLAGRFALSNSAMAGAIGEGYVASSSDAGLPLNSYTPDTWALTSEGNVNLYLLQDFGSVALNDQAILAKSIIESFYGQPPAYSYWSGCSQGGRQGLTLAQRYPNAYDGIAAAAPAIHWPQFFAGSTWAQTMMSIMGEFPLGCEFDALTDAAVAQCDPLDGVTDGLISDEALCNFDPFSIIGQVVSNCSQTGTDITITEAAAAIANETWTGPRGADGQFLWYGPSFQSRLTGAAEATGTTSDLGYAMTSCYSNGTCVGVDAGLGSYWFQLFVQKNSTWRLSEIATVEEFKRLFHAGEQQFDSFVKSNDPDLSEFNKAGGKIITYHGLADGLIPIDGTNAYYEDVLRLDPSATDFYRYFQVPGLAHCSGGNGGQPTATWGALVDWVENGIAPDTLPISFNDKDGVLHSRILCPYPSRAFLKSGCVPITDANCFECLI